MASAPEHAGAVGTRLVQAAPTAAMIVPDDSLSVAKDRRDLTEPVLIALKRERAGSDPGPAIATLGVARCDKSAVGAVD